jgi:hypothetical protein
MANRKYWVIVASNDHVQNGVRGGFAQACHGKSSPLKRIHAGDGVIYYSPKKEFAGAEKLQAFTAIGKFVNEKIYQFDMGGGFVPFRRDVEFFTCVPVAIQPLVLLLSFIRDKNKWGYVFRFGILEIPPSDFELIEKQMRA